MPGTNINFREERDLGQKINATFAFIRQNFKVLFSCILYFALPFALLAGIFSGIYQSRKLSVQAGNPPWRTWGEYYFFGNISSLNYLISMFFTLVSFVLISLTIYIYMVQYMDNGGKVTVKEVWEGIKSNFLMLFYAAVGIMVMCLMGYVFLLIPGIYLSIARSLVFMIMVREDVGFIESIERSFYLVKGYWWPTFGFVLLIGLIQLVFGLITYLPAMALGILNALKIPGADNSLLVVLSSSIAAVGGILLYTISITGIAFQYFNLVEIKDGIGLLQQVDLIGRTPERAESDEN